MAEKPAQGEPSFIAVHTHPIWRGEANFLIRAKLDDEVGNSSFEQLWAKKISLHDFLICCIPFFAYDISLGDIVTTDSRYVVVKSVKKSRYFVFRAFFSPSTDVEQQERFLTSIDEAVLYERFSSRLVSLCVEGKTAAEELSGYLMDAERRGELEYETARS